MKRNITLIHILAVCISGIALATVIPGCNQHSEIQGRKQELSSDLKGTEHTLDKKKEKESGKQQEFPFAFQFDEVVSRAGVDFVPRNGMEARKFTMLETLGTGVAIFDADRDGWMDLFFAGGGKISEQNISSLPSGLFQNQGKLSSASDWSDRFKNVTEFAAIKTGKYYSHGVVVGDYDSDGFEDLLVTGYGGIQFLRNQGDGSFLETEPEGMEETLWSTGGMWADLNGDHHPDLYIAHYLDWSWENDIVCGTSQSRNVCPPRRFQGYDDAIYFSNGDGSFTKAGTECGLSAGGKGLGVLACDPDQDMDIDIYVGNDTDDNFYYINDGKGNFEEIAHDRGVAAGQDGTPNGSMGLSLCDFNNDQVFDIWVTNFENESFALYKGHGDGFYQHSSLTTGITRMGATLVGWGTAWSDFDLDGDEDVVIANGHILYDSKYNAIPQLPVLMENHRNRMNAVKFEKSSYLNKPHFGRGLAAGDLDNDGDEDVVIANLNEPVAVLANNCQRKGDWLSVRLIGRHSDRRAVGAKLVLKTAAGSYLRQVTSGGSYISVNDSRTVFGIPEGEKVEQLVIHWQSGIVQEVNELKPNQAMTVIEPFEK